MAILQYEVCKTGLNDGVISLVTTVVVMVVWVVVVVMVEALVVLMVIAIVVEGYGIRRTGGHGSRWSES